MSVPSFITISDLRVRSNPRPFYCAISRKYGKRPVFLISGLFAIIGAAIGQGANTYEKLLAARIVQGFSTSPYESLIIAAIGDMYFVHQRGLRIALINFISSLQRPMDIGGHARDHVVGQLGAAAGDVEDVDRLLPFG